MGLKDKRAVNERRRISKREAQEKNNKVRKN